MNTTSTKQLSAPQRAKIAAQCDAVQSAAAFHRMGREDVRAGRMLGKEYMTIAACWRACAKELKQARTPNT